MRKTLSLVSLAVMPIALHAQAPSASPSDPGMSSRTVQSDQRSRMPARPTMPDQPTMQESSSPQAEQETQRNQRVQAAAVSAELMKKIDTKNAKVGDEVSIKTMSTTILPDGPSLPRGTKLIGKITDVQAKSKESNDSHLAFSVERAVLQDGKEIPVRAAVASVTAPANGSTASMPMGSAPSASSGGTGSTGAGGAGSAPNAPAMADADSASQSTQGGVLKSADDRVRVGNLPGVMLTGANSPESAGMLLASGKNIDLESGTKLILIVAAAA